ncbi:MAG: copper resistance protein CopC [Gammaproteobacteria bacterium]|nr:copper resistance protein CopC [Gammaproteobacteria bacterium]
MFSIVREVGINGLTRKLNSKRWRRVLSAVTSGICIGSWLCTASSLVWAQPTNHQAYRPTANSTEILSKTESRPRNDAVLEQAPDSISLAFPAQVRLVKLILRDENHQWVDIDFRYSPMPNNVFEWRLPPLADAAYYTAHWAILDYGEELIRGSFSFAFGPSAQAPSITRKVERQLLEMRYGDPTIRYVAPPRTTIILPQDIRRYDPPFIINLDELPEPQ